MNKTVNIQELRETQKRLDVFHKRDIEQKVFIIKFYYISKIIILLILVFMLLNNE